MLVTPTRSASCSFCREKRNWFWIAAAWVPAIAAIPASPAPAAAATMPASIAAITGSCMRCCACDAAGEVALDQVAEFVGQHRGILAFGLGVEQ